MIKRRNAGRMQRAVLITLVVLLCIGLILPSLAQIVYALMGY